MKKGFLMAVNILKRMMGLSLLASLGFVALLSLAQTDAALAATAPPLGNADSFAVLGATTVTNTGPTVVTGDLGLYPGTSITGFPPGTVIGTIQQTTTAAANAQTAATTAYNALVGQPCNFGPFGPTDLNGATLVPGVYCYSSSVQISVGGVLTLDAQGDPNAVWVFRIGSTLTTISGSSVIIINGGQDCNVFWQVGSSATLGTTSKVVGTIIAAHDITLNTGATVSGRVLARGVSADGAVTLDSNSVSVCSLSQPPPPGTPTLGKAFSPAAINENDISTLTITLSNPNLSVATLSAPLIDTLPTGVTIAATPNASTTCSGFGAVSATPGGPTVTLPATRSIPAGSGTTPGTCTVTVNVTAATAGTYLNTLVIGALQTSHGNNAAPAIATLTVNPPLVPGVVAPTVGKSFSPATISAGGTSTLTIILSNSSTDTDDTSATLTDNLPTGVVIANLPTINTCGGTLTATPGTGIIHLIGGTIPASSGSIAGTCTVTVDVTAATAGSYVNTLPVGALHTDQGDNAAPAIATLTVNPANAPPITPVPTLNEWGVIIFMVLAGLGSVYYLRKYRRV